MSKILGPIKIFRTFPKIYSSLQAKRFSEQPKSTSQGKANTTLKKENLAQGKASTTGESNIEEKRNTTSEKDDTTHKETVSSHAKELSVEATIEKVSTISDKPDTAQEKKPTFLQSKPHSNKKNQSSFLFLKANECDYGPINALLWKSFHPDEPIMKGMGLGHKPNVLIDDITAKILTQNLSIIAKCKTTGKLAGAALNELTHPWDLQDMLKHARTVSCKKTRQVLELFAFIRAAPNLFEKYRTDNIYEIVYLAVDNDFRKRGLGLSLMREAVIRGREKGCKHIRVDASNVFTAQICEKLGFKKVFEIPFDYYVDEDNKPIIKSEFPNVSCQIYLMDFSRRG